MIIYPLSLLLLLACQTTSNFVPIENHPCENYPSGTVLQIGGVPIVCLRKTEHELKTQLGQTGGYNRHYVAETLFEARKNFKNMFERYGNLYNFTDGWRRWKDTAHYSYSFDYAAAMDQASAVKRGSRERNRRTKFRSFTKRDIEIAKREVGSPIQCLESGYKTPDLSSYHLCPACQTVKELPKYFFPQFINELTCDNSTSGDASAPACKFNIGVEPIGVCKQATNTIDILVHKNGNFALTYSNSTHQVYKEVYEEQSFEIRTSCECLVDVKWLAV